LRLAGVDVPFGAAARLAVLLQRSGDVALAVKIGEAVDHLEDDVSLVAAERASVLRALEDCPDDLIPLRTALLEEALWNELT
jgi:hypothetical protein